MTQQFLLPCSCGQKTRITTSQAGEQVTCECGNRLSVPTLRGIRELDIAPAESNGPAGPGWTRIHGIAFSAGLLIALSGLALIAFFSLRYAQIRFDPRDLAKDHSSDIVQAASANADQLKPTELLKTWNEEIITEGLGERHLPLWVAAKATLTAYSKRILLGAALFATGALLAVGALLISRPRTA